MSNIGKKNIPGPVETFTAIFWNGSERIYYNIDCRSLENYMKQVEEHKLLTGFSYLGVTGKAMYHRWFGYQGKTRGRRKNDEF